MKNEVDFLTRNQKGAVLPMVILVMLLMVILSGAIYYMSTGNSLLVAVASSNEKALYAAEKGYNQTLWRLNNEDTDFLNPVDASSETYDDKDYHLYELTSDVDSNYLVNVLIPLTSNGIEIHTRCIIRSTGWDKKRPENPRSIEVELFKKAFTQYAVANDSERGANNNPLYWVPDEKVYGAIHTNDTFHILNTKDNYPIFYGPVTYKNGIKFYYIEALKNMDWFNILTPLIESEAANYANDPNMFRQGHSQEPDNVLTFSSSLNNLKSYARIDGDYYSGRTCIFLKGDTYDVRYYDSIKKRWFYNNVEYEFIAVPINSTKWEKTDLQNEATSKNNEYMFKTIIRNSNGEVLPDESQYYKSFSQLREAVPSLPLPTNGVIYVDGRSTNEMPGAISKFNPDNGNVFVSGELTGRLTIAAAKDIFIAAHDTCDWKRPSWNPNWYMSKPGVTYKNTTFDLLPDADNWTYTEVNGNDMLGLAASNYVNVLHYNWPSQYSKVGYWFDFFGVNELDNYCWTATTWSIFENIPADKAPYNIDIHAAIYAQNESFGYEASGANLDVSKKDTCQVFGSIAQKKRGRQGGTLDGYSKVYIHDPRLVYETPPHFPSPDNSGWHLARWDEIQTHIEQ